MNKNSKIFYSFVSIHTFLIGLFPFYIPVFLWKLGYSLANISYFIALAGAGFIMALWLWDKVRATIDLKKIIFVSFLLELLLLSTIFYQDKFLFLPLLAVTYGVYNCFFWITNRVMFFETISTQNSGKRYGDFQIIVVVFLKIGVFSGGLLLERYSFFWVFVVSILLAAVGLAVFAFNKHIDQLSDKLQQVEGLSLRRILRFKDEFRSRVVFSIDGFFLFLESYFWTISLFIIVKQSFWKLGLLVILLMAVFGLLFFIIKNRIDGMSRKRMYQLSVSLYIVSWILRGWLKEDASLPVLIIALVLITFFTSLFRLTFNKRFFDLAKSTSAQHYLLLKSYYSQFFIIVFFAVTGALIAANGDARESFQYTYIASSIIAVGYFFYRPHKVN